MSTLCASTFHHLHDLQKLFHFEVWDTWDTVIQNFVNHYFLESNYWPKLFSVCPCEEDVEREARGATQCQRNLAAFHVQKVWRGPANLVQRSWTEHLRIQSHLTPHRHSSGSGSSSWLATSPHCMWVGHSKPWKHSELRLWWIICDQECSEIDQSLHGVGELRCEPSISNFKVWDKLWLLMSAE